MSEPPKNKTSEAQIKAVARYRSNGVRKQVDFHGEDLEVLNFADSECKQQNIGFQRYVINLIRERMRSLRK